MMEIIIIKTIAKELLSDAMTPQVNNKDPKKSG